MDPEAALNDGIAALTDGYRDEAWEYAKALFDWIASGGYWPKPKSIAVDFLREMGFDPEPSLGPWGWL